MRKVSNKPKKQNFPEWAQFFPDYVLELRCNQICVNCRQLIPVRSLAMTMTSKTFICSDCVSRYYERVKLALNGAETQIHYNAYNLGHKLGPFHPGYLCRKLELKNGQYDPNFDRCVVTRVAYCNDCGASVCYQVVNILLGCAEMIIEEPIGFPLNKPCPKEE